MPKSSAMKRGSSGARRVDPDVAGVRVGVEEVVAEHLRVEQAHAFLGERLAVDAGRIERGEVVDRDAVHALQRQHALVGVRPDAPRARRDRREPSEIAPQQRWRWRLRAAGRARSSASFSIFGDDVARADLVGVRMGALDRRGERAQQRDVARRSALADVRAAAPSPRPRGRPCRRRRVHLRDRSRRQRRVVEARVAARRSARRARVSIDRARLAVRERRDAILQQRQLVGDVGRHQVAARRQDLPELDEDRPELGQRQSRSRAPRGSAAMSPRGRGSSGAQQLQRAVADAPRRPGRRAGSAPAPRRCAAGAGSAAAASRGGLRDARGEAAHARVEAIGALAQRIDLVEKASSSAPATTRSRPSSVR